MMTEVDLRRICRRYPLLNSHGFGLGSPFDHLDHREFTEKQRAAEFASSRRELLRSVDDCAAAAEWLKFLEPTKAPSLSSYLMKHVCEEAGIRRYITNGSFLAAALYLGIPIGPYPNSPNAAVGLSWRSVRPWWELTQPGAYSETKAAAILTTTRKPTFGRSLGIAAGVSCAACAGR